MDDIKLIIIANDACIRCKFQIELIKDIYLFEIYSVNNKKHSDVIKAYGIEDEYDIPSFIVLKEGKEVYRSHVPLTEQRIKQVTSN